MYNWKGRAWDEMGTGQGGKESENRSGTLLLIQLAISEWTYGKQDNLLTLSSAMQYTGTIVIPSGLYTIFMTPRKDNELFDYGSMLLPSIGTADTGHRCN